MNTEDSQKDFQSKWNQNKPLGEHHFVNHLSQKKLKDFVKNAVNSHFNGVGFTSSNLQMSRFKKKKFLHNENIFKNCINTIFTNEQLKEVTQNYFILLSNPEFYLLHNLRYTDDVTTINNVKCCHNGCCEPCSSCLPFINCIKKCHAILSGIIRNWQSLYTPNYL